MSEWKDGIARTSATSTSIRGPPGFVGLGSVNAAENAENHNKRKGDTELSLSTNFINSTQLRGPPGFAGFGSVNTNSDDSRQLGDISNHKHFKPDAEGFSHEPQLQKSSPSSSSSQQLPKTKIYLNVTFQEKDDAKLLGAMWDKDVKKWFAFSNCPNIEFLKQKYMVATSGKPPSSGTFSASSAFSMSPTSSSALTSSSPVIVGEKLGSTPDVKLASHTSTTSDLPGRTISLTDADKIYLGVNFADKDNAKLLGAMWDTTVAKWFVSSKSQNAPLLTSKYPINSTPVNLVGEDRNFGGNQLLVDLVPKGCSFSSCRFNVDACDFDRLFSHVTERASFTCECCGFDSRDNLNYLKIAERWSFDEETKTQKLTRLLCVCENCHKSIHMSKKDKIEATEHLQKVCGLSSADTTKHIQAAFALWGRRNLKCWTIDLTLLTNNGIKLCKE